MLLTTTSKINAIKDAMKAGDYDSAVEIAEKVNPEKVSSVRDLMTMANAFLKKKRYEDAKEVYVEMHNHASTHKVLVGLIELCLKTNSPEEAETYIREFRKQEPDNPERLIYRYRVDVMLGKGPEYLVKSLSRLKEEDYSDVWGLELAKAYYKMEDYQKCAQECKDLLLWFAGTESAAKAHVLLGACAEHGVTVKMPEVKAKPEITYDDEEAPDVPVIAATVRKEEPVEEEEEKDDTFFDLSAAIGETVSEAIAEDREKALEEEAAATDLEAVEDIKFPTEAVDEDGAEASDGEDEAAEADEAEDIEEDDSDADDGDAEEEIPEDATVPINLPPAEDEPEEDEAEEDEPVEEAPAEDLPLEEFDIIALAVKKAKEQEDDEDDVVIRDYYPEEEKRKSRSSWDNADAVPTLVTLPSSYRTEPKPAAEPANVIASTEAVEAYFEDEDEPEVETVTPEVVEEVAAEAEDFGFFEAEPVEAVETEEVIAETPAAEPVKEPIKTPVPEPVQKPAPEREKEAFLKSLTESFEQSLSADVEEEDGQISFFANTKDEDDDITLSIAEAVKDELENGKPEADEVSKAPTKVHTDLAAQALEAVLKEDDEAVEKALYGLLSDK